MTVPLKAPFPWFGGKSRAAPLIWEVLGDPANYIEPFAGGMAVLLGRPCPPQHEIINDKDGFVCNVWRSLAFAPAQVAHHAGWPINENDLHARHMWLKTQRKGLTARLEGDIDYFDAKIAGWWLWGIACWIGGEWCNTGPHSGPWVIEKDAEGMDCLVRRPSSQHTGITRQHPGMGQSRFVSVHRKRPILRHAGHGVKRTLPAIARARGIHRNMPPSVDITDTGHPLISASREILLPWFRALQDRLRNVRVCCGSWVRVLTPACTVHHGMTGILLDPPYAVSSGRDKNVYAVDEQGIAQQVEDWCLRHGAHPLLRIVLCGYGETHDVLLEHGWRKYAWIAQGGMGNQCNGRGKSNRFRERIWCSPACLTREQLSLFEEGTL